MCIYNFNIKPIFFVKKNIKNMFFVLTNRQNIKIMFFENNKKRSVDSETCSGTLIFKNPKIHKNNQKTVFLMRSVGVKTILWVYKNNKFRTTQHRKHMFFTRKNTKISIHACWVAQKTLKISFLKWFFRDIALIIEGSKSFFSSFWKCMWQCSS